MITEDEARSALRMAELMVKNGVDRGCPKSPATPLEKHAFELGRVSVLRWVLDNLRTTTWVDAQMVKPDLPVEPTT